MSVERIAESFVKELIRSGMEPIPVECHVDRKLCQIAHETDVEAFLETIQDRFDVSEIDTDIPLNVALEESAIDLDLDVERLILARRLHRHLTFYAGLHRTGRVLWVKDSRLAKVFESESDVLTEVFQFGGADEDMAVLKEVFANLDLQMIPAPSLPSF
jgi:hypothetical protein